MDIFDLSDISDLPKEIQDEISKRDVYSSRILELFKLSKKPLGVIEVQAAYFRKFGEIKSSGSITQKLYSMASKKNAKIKRTEHKSTHNKAFYILKK